MLEKMKLFAIWLDGFMDACGPSFNEEQTNMIKTKLNDLFEHDAELVNASLEKLGEEHGFTVYPGFPGSNIHGTGDNSELYRC